MIPSIEPSCDGKHLVVVFGDKTVVVSVSLFWEISFVEDFFLSNKTPVDLDARIPIGVDQMRNPKP